MINPTWIFVLMGTGLLIFIASFSEFRHDNRKHGTDCGYTAGAITATAGNATATATGNVINQHQHFHFDGLKVEDLGNIIAEKLKAGTMQMSAEEERIAAAPQRLAATDGFVQLETIDLQVPSPDLARGQWIKAKYSYANRGVLPVYEVQTWGFMLVLDIEKNSGPNLKAVMIAAAKEGHSKFPGAGSLGVQLSMHSFASLNEPLTQEQIDTLHSKSSALFLLIGGVWVDNQTETHFWAACRRAEFPVGLTWNSFTWTDL